MQTHFWFPEEKRRVGGSHSLREVPEVLCHAEESAAEQFGRRGEAVVNDTSCVSDPETLETLAGRHYRSNVKQKDEAALFRSGRVLQISSPSHYPE